MTQSPPKAPIPNAVPLGVKILTHEFWEDSNIQSIAWVNPRSGNAELYAKCVFNLKETASLLKWQYHFIPTGDVWFPIASHPWQYSQFLEKIADTFMGL